MGHLMDHLRGLDIVFENCEVAHLDKDDIKSFFIGKIYEKKYHTPGGGVAIDYYTDKAKLEIFSSADDKRVSLMGVGNSTNLFERICKYSDIVGFDVLYDSGSHQLVYIPYEESDVRVIGSPNIYQRNRTIVNSKGNFLRIDIKER